MIPAIFVLHGPAQKVRPGEIRPGPNVFGRRTHKPNSVLCGHSSRRRVAADAQQRPTRRFRPKLEQPCGIGPMPGANLAPDSRLPPYLVLLRVGFTLPPSLLPERCALTAPFHPYPCGGWTFGRILRSTPERLPKEAPSQWRAAMAVSSLWHWPSTGLDARVPDVIRHTALRSSDFPLPELRPKPAPAATARFSCLRYCSAKWVLPPFAWGVTSPPFSLSGWA